MKLTVGDDGFLRNERGESLGRIVAMEIELDSPSAAATLRGREGLEVVNDNPSTSASSRRKAGSAQSSISTPEVRFVWEHYISQTGSKRVLDAKRTRIIRTALKTAGNDQVMLAITGLSRSPWHNGENPERKKYLEIRYALKGIGDESDDERIEKMCDLAVVHDPRRDGIDPVKVERWLEHVRYTAERPHSERERAVKALGLLRSAGFEVKRIDKRPWVVIS